ncbi:Na/Pi cotransporter family protein [Patescibacteria group bacterium]|nr:Na/Pi cotransporter family protein [Patescibacteria group bacterium]
MIEIEAIFELMGGIAILLYGIHISGVSLQKILGFKLEEILTKTNNNPIKGLTIGTGITALIQSSGTTITMLVGFISAGLLTFGSAIPVMLGANIGSTITTQIASLNIGVYALLILTIGVIIHVFSTAKIRKNFGEAIVGFSFLFLGMHYIFQSVHLLAQDVGAVNFINYYSSSSPFIYIFILAILTLIIQSSSATSVVVVALGATQIIDLQTALFMILGVNLGSSLKVIYISTKTRGFLSDIAVTHILLNTVGIIVFVIFFKYFSYLASITSLDAGRQIANAHTFYNIITALIVLPFVPLVVKFINKYIPKYEIGESKFSYLSRKLLYTPSVALRQANRAVVEMAKEVADMLEISRSIFFQDKIELLEEVEILESNMDVMTGKISEYMSQISQQRLSKKDLMKLYSLMHSVTDLEHLSDHILAVSELFVELKEEDIKFSEKANHELTAIFGKLKMMQNLVIKSLSEDNLHLAHEIIKHENKVDEIVKKSQANHLERMSEGICSFQYGKYFSDILMNLERIGDHSDNIAYAIVDRFRYK